MTFYIEKPRDDFGNYGYGVTTHIDGKYEHHAVVIEGEVDARGHISVTAPTEFQSKWPSVYIPYFYECEGPARLITDDERFTIIDRIQSRLRGKP